MNLNKISILSIAKNIKYVFFSGIVFLLTYKVVYANGLYPAYPENLFFEFLKLAFAFFFVPFLIMGIIFNKKFIALWIFMCMNGAILIIFLFDFIFFRSIFKLYLINSLIPFFLIACIFTLIVYITSSIAVRIKILDNFQQTFDRLPILLKVIVPGPILTLYFSFYILILSVIPTLMKESINSIEIIIVIVFLFISALALFWLYTKAKSLSKKK